MPELSVLALPLICDNPVSIESSATTGLPAKKPIQMRQMAFRWQAESGSLL